jgi:hypothetical protein
VSFFLFSKGGLMGARNESEERQTRKKKNRRGKSHIAPTPSRPNREGDAIAIFNPIVTAQFDPEVA